MFSFIQVRSGETLSVPKKMLSKMDLFQSHPELVESGRYAIKSNVAREVVDMFFARIMGDNSQVVTVENAEEMRQLCNELGFSGFDNEIRAVLTDTRAPVQREFVCIEGIPLDGIIAHLTRECGGNVHKKGVVEVTGSSWATGSEPHVADLGTNAHFQSNDEPNSWICYNFKERRVAPTSYSIRMCCWGFMRSWVLEVSNDGMNWEVVDRQENSNDLRGAFMTHNFVLSSPPSGSFRFIRLRQTGKNDGGLGGCPDDTLILTALEVFGTLTSNPRPIASPGEFPFNDMRPLEGVIAHLTRECGGNVHEKGVVEVTASSCTAEGYEAKNAVDLGTDSSFWSKIEPNPWIRYDFKDRRVIPTSYSMRSAQWFWPRSWVFEVSNDGQKWEIIDNESIARRDNNCDPKAMLMVRNFTISARPSESFRFVRLRQTEKTQLEVDHLALSSLEIFGTLSRA